jgi:hypothetical protein
MQIDHLSYVRLTMCSTGAREASFLTFPEYGSRARSTRALDVAIQQVKILFGFRNKSKIYD